VSDPVVLLTPGTPQNKALEWLVEDDKFSSCPQDPKMVQRYVMAVFYYSTDGGNWNECNAASDVCDPVEIDSANDNCTILGDGLDVFDIPIVQGTDSWLSPSYECFWGGLSCRADTLCMDRIEFENDGLGGTLPFELRNLTELRYLIVEEGTTSSTIPSEYGTFSTLHIVDLNFNQLTGTIPIEIYNLPLLFQLDLNDNLLTGTIATEIGAVPFLQFLQLEVNRFSGTIPTEMGNNSFLRVAEFFDTMLTGDMPQGLCNLRENANGALFRLTADCDPDDMFLVNCSVPDCCSDCPL